MKELFASHNQTSYICHNPRQKATVLSKNLLVLETAPIFRQGYTLSSSQKETSFCYGRGWIRRRRGENEAAHLGGCAPHTCKRRPLGGGRLFVLSIVWGSGILPPRDCSTGFQRAATGSCWLRNCFEPVCRKALNCATSGS